MLQIIDTTVISEPDTRIVQVLDPRPLFDQACRIGAAYRSSGRLVTETLAAGLAHGRALWFGSPSNVGRRLAEIAAELGVTINVV